MCVEAKEAKDQDRKDSLGYSHLNFLIIRFRPLAGEAELGSDRWTHAGLDQ